MKRYEKYLKQYAKDVPYQDGIKINCSSELEYITNHVTAPIMVSYVWWILLEAKQKNISTLYFLARDGYTLCKIAELFCEKFQLNIQCRYLYCSRAALRMPTYHFLGEEAYSLLFMGGSYLTADHVLDRIDCTEEEREKIFAETNFDIAFRGKIFSWHEHETYCKKLRTSNTYNKIVKEKSESAYTTILGYFQQEGLTQLKHIAIVDSGWTGSMQRSFRQILEYAGHTPKITGFYFGMYAKQKEQQDGTYCTWYFNQRGPIKNTIMFSNNLFETMLTAPHGMTVGYELQQGTYKPIQKAAPQGKRLDDILVQQRTILSFTNHVLKKINFFEFHSKQHLKLTKKLLTQLMVKPEKAEVLAYQHFLFCDDITESYQLTLHTENADLSRYLILRRIYRKFISKKQEEPSPEVLWHFGSIAFFAEI